MRLTLSIANFCMISPAIHSRRSQKIGPHLTYSAEISSTNRISVASFNDAELWITSARLSKTRIYERIREVDSLSPVPIGKQAVGWIESEIKQWAASRVFASRSVLHLNAGKRPPHSVRSEPETSLIRFA